MTYFDEDVDGGDQEFFLPSKYVMLDYPRDRKSKTQYPGTERYEFVVEKKTPARPFSLEADMDVVHVVEGEILPIDEPLPESAPRTGKREIMRELSDHELEVPPFRRKKRKRPRKTVRKARTEEVVTKDWVDVIGEEIRSASTHGLFAIVDTVNEMVKEAVMQAAADSDDLASCTRKC